MFYQGVSSRKFALTTPSPLVNLTLSPIKFMIGSKLGSQEQISEEQAGIDH
jgi:hypothetical protein